MKRSLFVLALSIVFAGSAFAQMPRPPVRKQAPHSGARKGPECRSLEKRIIEERQLLRKDHEKELARCQSEHPSDPKKCDELKARQAQAYERLLARQRKWLANCEEELKELDRAEGKEEKEPGKGKPGVRPRPKL